MTDVLMDTQADVQRAEALVAEAGENWRSAERDLDEASGKYSVANGRMLELSAEASELSKKHSEASDAASLQIVHNGYSAKSYSDVARAKAELDAVSAAVSYIGRESLPGLKKAEVAAKLQERRSALDYHRAMSRLEEARVLHSAAGLAGSGAMIDMSESTAAKYGAAAVELAKDVERLQGELDSL